MMLVTVSNTPSIIKQPASLEPVANVETATTTEPNIVINIENATSTQDVKRITKEFYKETPILASIANCESQFRQFSSQGVPLRGIVNSADVGVMQINEKYHSARSKQLGMDIHTLEGNLEYGARLYKEQGTRPWNASKPCWGPATETVAVNI